MITVPKQRLAQVSVTALLLALGACGPSERLDPYPDSKGSEEITLDGTWVIHTRRTEVELQGEDRYQEQLVRFSDTAQGIVMYLDLDQDGAFGESISLSTENHQEGARMVGEYFWNGVTHSFDAQVWELSWGHAAGDVTLSDDQTPERTDSLVMLKVANPPLADLNGVWDMNHLTEWATGPLQYMAGYNVQELWTIKQYMDGPMHGFFEARSPSGECFVGMVNDTQITFANRYILDGWKYTFTYTNVNVDGDWLSGTHIGQAEQGAQFEELGWLIEGVRIGG